MTEIMKQWFSIYSEEPLLILYLLILAAINGYILSRSWKRIFTYSIAILQIPTVWIIDIWYFHKVKGYLTYDWDSAISFYTVPLLWLSLPVINGTIVYIVNQNRKNKRQQNSSTEIRDKMIVGSKHEDGSNIT